MITNEQIKELADDPLALSKFLQRCAQAIINHHESPKVINNINLKLNLNPDLAPPFQRKIKAGKRLTVDDFPTEDEFNE